MSRFRETLIALALVAVSTGVGLLLAETVLWVRAGFHATGESTTALFKYEDLYVSSRPIAHFDPVSGYRRVEGPMRIVRIMRDELIYDSTFTPNNKGYTTVTDFRPAKTDPDVFRLVVFGDSFTAGEYLEVPWPDRVNRALEGRTARPMELYAFAVNGGGAWNWHSIFFNDVVPNYQFDAVLLAVWGDNVDRGFTVLHYDAAGQSYLQRMDHQPASVDAFLRDDLPRMPKHYARVAPDAEIDAMIAAVETPWRPAAWDFRVPRLVGEQVRRLTKPPIVLPDTAIPSLPTDPTLEAIAARHDPVKFEKLTAVIAYCRERGIPVILVSVPSHDSALNAATTKGVTETEPQQELRVLARSTGADYFDGHLPFAAADSGDIDALYWFKYDGHWNQAGSDLFAEAMARYLIDRAPELAARR